MLRRAREIFGLAIVALFALCGIAAAAPATQPSTQPDDALMISAASSLQDALRQIQPVYEQESGQKLRLNFLGSGQLLMQIEQGADVDLFISASSRQVDQLVARHMVFDQPFDVLGNELVLIVPKDATEAPRDFSDLADERFKRIAMGEPQAVPAGDYAGQVLRKLDIAAKVKPRLVYGASVRQVLQYVQRGEVDAGIVYASDAHEAGDSVKVVASADPAWHEPIVYRAAVIASSSRKPEARALLKYLLSDAAQDVFHSHGFRPAPARTDDQTPGQSGGR
jgi:molybdate transport system substrate-binding protein